jgi:S-adenosylmethionine hydrolase
LEIENELPPCVVESDRKYLVFKTMNYDENGYLVGTGSGVTVNAKACRFEDVFPKVEEVDRFGNMLPDVVRKHLMEIKAQKQLAEAASLIMDTMKAMESMNLTDDQQRSARIKERMLKRKLLQK